MQSKTFLPVLIISGLLLMSSCIVEKEDRRQEYQDHLIAQASIIPGATIHESTISEIIAADTGYSKLESILDATEFLDTFDSSKPFTIFAPGNNAFNSLYKGKIDKMIAAGEKEQLIKILNNHIIPSQINVKDMIKAIDDYKGSVKLKTLGGVKLTLTMKGNTLYLIDDNGNRGRLVSTDVKTASGYIHTIDGLMMPKQ